MDGWRRKAFSLSTLAVIATLQLTATDARASDNDAVRDWRPGDPPPLGYHVGRKHTLGIVGVSLAGGAYASGSLIAFAITTECYWPGPDGSASTRCSDRPSHHSAPWLLVPFAGPFIALTYDDVRNDGGSTFWCITFATLQTVGTALVAYDLVVPRYELKRGDAVDGRLPTIVVSPTLARGPGVVVTGTF